MNPEERDPLEGPIHDLIRGLPVHRAPQGLEARVLNTIAGRSALPWWRQSFAAWPVPARFGFALVCLAAVAVCLLPLILIQPSLPIIGAEISEAASRHLGTAIDGITAIRVAGTAVVSWIRPIWLYAILSVVALSYATLAGLGIAAWRTVHINRSRF